MFSTYEISNSDTSLETLYMYNQLFFNCCSFCDSLFVTCAFFLVVMLVVIVMKDYIIETSAVVILTG